MNGTGQDRVNGPDRTIRLDRAGVASWPARETWRLEGWLLRFTAGFGGRANSVMALDFADEDVEGRIDAVEHTYRQRGFRPMFQITPASKPTDLERRLFARRYRSVTPSMVCSALPATIRQRLPEHGAVKMQAIPGAEFERLVIDGSRSPGDGRERMEILSSIALPHICVTVLQDGEPTACGLAVNAGGLVGINLMRTAQAARRQGHARRVLSAIAQWAEAENATELFLSVESGNAAARALYAGAGFEDVYAYRYWRLD